ncbi:MAG: hypothetical protein HWE25_16860 [Alphaproteobacteria bacterium]|nr:hypothetical protein [Alphaproteobacteria bacterium]
MTVISDEMLMAYADDELSLEERELVEAALKADPSLKAKLTRHFALKAEIDQAFAFLDDTPLPERLETMLAPRAEIIPFYRRKPVVIGFTSLAASLLIAVVFVGSPKQEASSLAVPWSIAQTLETKADGEQTAVVQVGESYLRQDGTLCRDYYAEGNRTLACREDSGWQAVASVKQVGEGKFAPAGMEEADDVNTQLSMMEQLAPGAERALLTRNE